MPGYGASAPLADGYHTMTALAERARDLLDHLRIATAVVVGHSLGGFVAQELALAHGDRVDRLVLVASTAAFGKPGSTFNRDFLADRLEPLDAGKTPAALAPAVVDGLLGPRATAAARADAIASMSAIPVDGYRAALEALVDHDAADRLPTLTTPTLGIAGELDATASVRAMERLISLMPSARLEIIADCGHLINTEQPRHFNRLLAAFLP